jgi:hypothetical protein
MNERLLYRIPEGKLGDGSNCRSTLGICIPANVLLSQELAVFLAYARSNAVKWPRLSEQIFRIDK